MVIEEAARYIRLRVSAIYERTAPGAADPIPHVRIGRLLRFRQADLDAWMAARNTAVPKKKAVGR
jgi:excisionase family DNA binding protein